MTFSQHAAQYKSSQIYYLFLWLVCLPLFYVFMVAWFVPEFSLGWISTLCISLGSLGLAIAATVPETTGWRVTVHRYSAFGQALFLLPVVLIIAVSPEIGNAARLFAGLSTIIMLSEVLLLTYHKRAHPKMLLIQGSYIMAFHLTILIATYTN